MPRGGMPKRSEERRRRNKVPGLEKVQLPAEDYPLPELPDDLHEVAVAWYRALPLSGQSVFYEPTDWERARAIAIQLSRMLKNPEPGASLVAATFTAMETMLDSEASRRRVRLEILRQKEAPADDPKVTRMRKLKKALG